MLNIEEIKAFILDKVNSQAERFEDRLPTYVNSKGKYEFTENGGWVGGFWPGINWLCYEMTKDEKYIDYARAGYHRLRERLYQNPESLDHDVGFLYTLSALADYKVTHSESAKLDAFNAAKELRTRYNSKGNFIRTT